MPERRQPTARNLKHSPASLIKFENLIPPIVEESFKAKLRDSLTALVRLEDQLDYIRRTILTRNKPTWNGLRQVTQSLKWQLNLRSLWLQAKSLFVNASSELDTLLHHLDIQSKGPCTNQIRRKVSSRRSFEPAGNSRPHDFMASVIHPVHHQVYYQVVTYWHALVRDSEMLFDQSKPMLSLPEWQDIKKHCPIGGRNAYSVLMVCQKGWSHKTLSSENKMFDWYHNESKDSSLQQNIRLTIRRIQCRPEKHGQAPSWAAGAEIVNKYYAPIEKSRNVNDRLSTLRFWHNERRLETSKAEDGTEQALPGEYELKRKLTMAALDGIAGYNGTPSASMIYLCLYPEKAASEQRDKPLLQTPGYNNKDRKVAKAIIKKIMVPGDSEFYFRTNVTTMLTGPVVRASGDDYYAPCVWPVRNSYENSEKQLYKMQRGWILLRRNWPDMYHMPCRPAEVRGIVPSSADATTLVEHISEHSWNNPPTHAEISAQLDLSSRDHFRRQKDEKERLLSAKQRKVVILKRLRALPLLTRDDSYKAGNCNSGTENFINLLQVKAGCKITDVVNGTELAKGWRKAGYPQMDNLSRVASYLTDKVAEMKAAAELAAQAAAKELERATVLAGNPEVAVHTEYAADYEAMLQTMRTSPAVDAPTDSRNVPDDNQLDTLVEVLMS